MNIETTPIRQAAEEPPTWRPRNALLRLRVFLYLVAADCLCIVAGFALVAVTREPVTADANWVLLLATLIPVYLAIGFSSHAYASEHLQDPFRAISKGGQAFAVAIGAVILVAFYLQTSASLPRLTIALGSILAALLLTTARYFLVRHLARIVGGNPFSVVLILDGEQPVPFDATTVIFAGAAGIDPDLHDPVMYDRLASTLETADRVVVACSPERRQAWASLLKGANVQSEIVMPELAALAPLGVGIHDGEPTVIVGHGPLGMFDRFIKRSFDIVVAGLALIAFLPFMLVVAVLVRLDSPGPVLFLQTRIGRGNQMFRMLKFRSMYAGDRHGDRSAERDDDRVTRVGRFIRRTSIDELPQLVNVLAGSMSIVGPRPHALGSRAESKLFWDIDGRYWHRHATKPGLTGLAQIRGYRGATMVEDDLRNRLQADLEYLENWSIWRDVKIIALTARVLLHRNAF